jgi:site-specific recombinase XerD
MSDGSTSAGGGVCDAEAGKQPAITGQTPLAAEITDFLNFCRIEKGLAANSLEAYAQDLRHYDAHFQALNGSQHPSNHTDTVMGYLNSLYRSGLGSRSIAIVASGFVTQFL